MRLAWSAHLCSWVVSDLMCSAIGSLDLSVWIGCCFSKIYKTDWPGCFCSVVFSGFSWLIFSPTCVFMTVLSTVMDKVINKFIHLKWWQRFSLGLNLSRLTQIPQFLTLAKKSLKIGWTASSIFWVNFILSIFDQSIWDWVGWCEVDHPVINLALHSFLWFDSLIHPRVIGLVLGECLAYTQSFWLTDFGCNPY